MSRQAEQLWSMLAQADVVEGPLPELAELDSPWYVKVLLAFSGWLASLFIIGFITAGIFAFLMDNEVSTFIVGGAFVGGAYLMLRTAPNEFLEHLALAFSLAGQVFMAKSLHSLFGGYDEVFWMILALLQGALAIVVPNTIHRGLTSFAAAIAFAMALISMKVPYVAGSLVMLLMSWLWLNEFRYPHYMKQMQAIGYGLVLALISISSVMIFGSDTMYAVVGSDTSGIWVRPWMGAALTSAVTLYVIWQLLQRHGHAISERFTIVTLLASTLFCAASFEARGIATGMVIIVLGFTGGNRVLMGLGVAFLLFALSSYYYLLDATLLIKSLTLLMIGLVLLMARWAILRVMPTTKEA